MIKMNNQEGLCDCRIKNYYLKVGFVSMFAPCRVPSARGIVAPPWTADQALNRVTLLPIKYSLSIPPSTLRARISWRKIKGCSVSRQKGVKISSHVVSLFPF